jgi:DNA-binding NarL/FixJ family response regulator
MLRIRILIASDSALILKGVRRLLESEKGFDIVAEANDADATLKLVKTFHPTVVIYDLSMLARETLDYTAQLAKLNVPKLAMSFACDDQSREVADRSGACKLLDKCELATNLVPAVFAAFYENDPETARSGLN